ncbi:MAG: type II toxin-antitoxin system VapC family toxin [Chloracidobacterium sp.]|nr:type II toxin-antitoxin system VapC family toxin [Chloracidobacterium sp.]
MKKPKSIVLDSWAILAYFQDEPSGEKVADLIADSQEAGIPLLMSVVNVGEVWYSIARRRSAKDADEAVREIRAIGIDFVEADWELTSTAAAYKAKGAISYADCFAAALVVRTANSSDQTSCTLVTGDPEFKQVETEIEIVWL